MPHCIAEHSSNIDGSILLEALFNGALKSELFEADGRDIKVRATPYNHYQVGTGPIDFIHVQLKILSGRTSQQKSALSQSVLTEIALLVSQPCSITVEVTDIDRSCYAKLMR